MEVPAIKSVWVRILVAMLGLMWLGAGWFIILTGGFHKSYKYSNHTTFVDGWSAFFMAYIFLALAAGSSVMLLESISVPKPIQIGVAAAILITPLLYRFCA